MTILKKHLAALLVASSTCLLYTSKVLASDIKVNRISGQDRFETCSNIADSGWTKSDYAVLVNSEMYADAVVSSPLADKYKSPILLVENDNIPDTIVDELNRLRVKKVFILGGTSLISKNVENKLKNMGISIEERIAGQDRYETAVKVASHITNSNNSVYVVNGEDWRDALAISPVATISHSPIIFTNKYGVPDVVKKNIDNASRTYNVIGEKDDYDFLHNIEQYLGGKQLKTLGYNKADTNIEVYNSFKDKMKLNKVYLASSKAFADGLCISPLAGTNKSPLFFVDENNINEFKDFLDKNRNSIEEIDVIGGQGVIADSTMQTLLKLNTTASINNSDSINNNRGNGIPNMNGDNNEDVNNDENNGSITPIMGQSQVSVEQCEKFLRKRNSNAPYLASIYKKYCDIYGIRLECAWVQMCLETNFLRYSDTSITTLNMNNYAGLGALDSNGRGQALSFSTEDDGVKCHVQHLFAYSSRNPLPVGEVLIDPRFNLVQRGCAPKVEDLGNGKWASDKEYAHKLLNLLNELK
ncbi:cell wall-binding protein [Clostridium sp. P21]|uniref:Cell wall-binding protein n=1 Tax=Clostridium muellerianum TaxID=2716538 RepID=A0A7Y0EKA5_9CLOT|nr:cell wall-binding repeat-containing protein [Clostridium muellerianum]NMM65034.1 cell wall-binding protein [Clostridium muellerianum]